MSEFSGRSIRYRAFVREQPKVEWLIDKLLPNVGSTLLVGSKGVGKTTLALQMVAAIQEGSPIFGLDTEQRETLFIQMDSRELEWREICRRVVPQSMGRTMLSLPAFCLDNPSYVKAIGELIIKSAPGFIIWDSLYKLSNKRKINTDAVLETMQILDLLCMESPYMLLHHPPHGESRASGHNSLSGTVSNEWVLLKNMLRIDKGRLIEIKEILLQRAKSSPGLWYIEEGEEEEELNRKIRNMNNSLYN